MDAGNLGKKKSEKNSGAANRRWKKAKLEEEAKLKNQMRRYFVNLPAGNSSHSNSSLLPHPLSSSRNNTLSSTKNTSSSTNKKPSSANNTPSSTNNDPSSPNNTSSSTNNALMSAIDTSFNNIDADDFGDVSSDSDGAASYNDGNGSSDNESGDECTSGLQNVTLQKTFVVSIVVGRNISQEEKSSLLNEHPCQPSKMVLSQRRKRIGDRDRCCSEQVFKRQDGSQRSWLTYCLEKEALYCIPCLLFSDSALRGENQRRNQGKAFAEGGFSNWKKQYTAVNDHEASQTHMDSKLAQVMFLQHKSMEDIFHAQANKQEEVRKRHVEANRNIMKRVIDTVILLGKQELAFRGHHESLASDPSCNIGNFLETLKFLANYDEVTAAHLEKVEKDHRELEEKKIGTKKGDPSRRFGRGSRLTFLSYDIQNKIIDIISKEIVSEIVMLIKDCLAWALIADTTPDVAKHEQLSVCVRVVSKGGEVSEHLLFCTRALATTADELLNNIAGELERLAVPFSNLVAQTYDGASNMSGKYNGLQAKIKEIAGEHVIFVHCYAHTLNLVLGDTACASLDVAKLFENLQSLYVMVSKSHPINQIFEEYQRQAGLPVRALKRINTVRWSAREFCLDMFLQRYDSVMLTLERVSTVHGFDSDKRSLADGMRKLFSTKQFIASAYLFREIFAMTGPLSRTLQSVNIDFGKALDLLDTALKQLKELRDYPQKILNSVDNDFEGVDWEEKRIGRKKRMPGELGSDEPATSADEKWRRDMFYTAVDSVISGINDRFSGSRHVLEAFSVFSPKSFPTFLKSYPTTGHVEESIREFCETYGINSHRCASELFSFASAFKLFNFYTVSKETKELDDEDQTDDDHDNDDMFVDGESDDHIELDEDVNSRTFIDCLSILTNKQYKLIDAYPTLVRVYGIALAIPITSCSAERSFSTLKRVKTRLRSTMLQERLEGLLIMSIERKLLMNLDRDRLIDLLGKSSKELGKALLR